MRKQVFGRKLSRDANERKALLKGLMNDLVLKETLQTTEEKAKSIKGQVEKLVTKAKVKGEAARTLLQPYLTPKAIEKVLTDLAPRFANRPGGYTRIVKLGERFGDNANVAIIEWVEKSSKSGSKNQEASTEEKNVEKVEAVVKTEKKNSTKKTAEKPVKKETKEKKSSKK